MIGKVLNLFGCHHRHITRPIAGARHQPASSYVACLECGKVPLRHSKHACGDSDASSDSASPRLRFVPIPVLRAA